VDESPIEALVIRGEVAAGKEWDELKYADGAEQKKLQFVRWEDEESHKAGCLGKGYSEDKDCEGYLNILHFRKNEPSNHGADCKWHNRSQPKAGVSNDRRVPVGSSTPNEVIDHENPGLK